MPAAKKGDYDKARERTKAGTNVTGGGGGGLFSNIVSGIGSALKGGRSQGAPTSSDRPQARPDVLVKGTGKDRTYTDTRTGQTYKEPEYRPFSLKGLTSTDPANVARNRAAAARYAADSAARLNNRSDSWERRQQSEELVKGAEPAPVEPEKPEKPNLALIGAPTTPMLSPEVATPAYGLASLVQPTPNYAQAFQPMQPLPALQFDIYGNPLPLNYMDIFGTYPDFLPRA